MLTTADIRYIQARIDGEIRTDLSHRIMYSTDASDYRERPFAVAYPKTESDIRELVRFAAERKLSLIPRTAGTSLAGQVVGAGLVVDVSRYLTSILEINEKERWVRVQPGVILDELNMALKSYGLFFSPETSTSNRSMIGGMIGNNSCGLHSLVYGTTRDHTLRLRTILSDASVAEFGPLTAAELAEKGKAETLEGKIYREIHDILSDEENQAEIHAEFPDPKVVRRNTGYALDELLNCRMYGGQQARYPEFNMCRLIAGSEGTLAFITEAILHLDVLPPEHKVLIPVHFNSVKEAIRGNLLALSHRPTAVELMDKTILDCTRENITQRKNRFFLKGDPGAILMVELLDEDPGILQSRISNMIQDMKNTGIGYHFPVVSGTDIARIWNLRKAGLGVLSNLPGDGRPVSVIEDTSVNVEVLEEYIDEFDKILGKYDLKCVYHAHISVGELHLRPVLNLKDEKDVALFHEIAYETAKLVKKYRGSLSGEHGDGRLRGEFIPLMIGERNYALLKQVKAIWDPKNIFNPGKIIDSPPMNSFLRHTPGEAVKQFNNYMDFSREGGMMHLIEKCNGSGDCRKTERSGGTMCPSYMASREESSTTRARANILREMLTHSDKKNPFDHKEVYDVLDLCLSCKACKSECPSNVDMAKLKAEFLQHWYNSHGIPVRTRLIAYITRINRLGSMMPGLFNFFVTNRFFSGTVKRFLGFAAQRSIPTIHKFTWRRWLDTYLESLNSMLPPDAPEIVLFVDEFTNYNDPEIGILAVRLLNKLQIRVVCVKHPESGRSFISKGMLKRAKILASRNIEIFSPMVNEHRPLLGIEPSAILGFRDEIPDLVEERQREIAHSMSAHCYTIEEYLAKMADEGKITRDQFTLSGVAVKLHGHCQQKAIASTECTKKILSLPLNYTVEEIPSGCCGMAGSFGYEKEHYDLSMKVGELVLFPAIRRAGSDTIIAAPGTSCRQQIKDGTKVHAKHPVEILYEALK